MRLNPLCRFLRRSIFVILYLLRGVTPQSIRLKVEGADSLSINATGELEALTGHGVIRFSRPFAYQMRGGKKENIQVDYRLEEDIYGFTIGQYDRSLPLIIDPYLSYALLIGNYGQDTASRIFVDPHGYPYVTGYYNNNDLLLAKIDLDGSAPIYVTVIGGNGGDWGESIFVDALGNAYVTGETTSTDFPFARRWRGPRPCLRP